MLFFVASRRQRGCFVINRRERRKSKKDADFRESLISSRGGFSASKVRWHSMASCPGVRRNRLDRVGGHVGREAENSNTKRRS